MIRFCKELALWGALVVCLTALLGFVGALLTSHPDRGWSARYRANPDGSLPRIDTVRDRSYPRGER